MTCREFEHRAASLSLRELSQVRDEQALDHVDQCEKCAAWLQQQRMLAASMQTLQARTAACEAGLSVERALLRGFRQRTYTPEPPVTAHCFTPIAMRLSRFFEAGAYVAVAAAIVIGLFLAVRLWEHRAMNGPTNNAVTQPAPSLTGVVAEAPKAGVPQQPAAVPGARNPVRPRRPVPTAPSRLNPQDASQATLAGDYVALMFCDPLSCSSDAQVVRMELPNPASAEAGGESEAQMRIADVVVGYDGVVRAVRIVN